MWASVYAMPGGTAEDDRPVAPLQQSLEPKYYFPVIRITWGPSFKNQKLLPKRHRLRMS